MTEDAQVIKGGPKATTGQREPDLADNHRGNGIDGARQKGGMGALSNDRNESHIG
jgi:hypothetical protein